MRTACISLVGLALAVSAAATPGPTAVLPPMGNGVVVVAEFGPDFHVITSTARDCYGYKVRRESRDLRGIEQAAADAAVAFFQQQGVAAQRVDAELPPDGRALRRAELARLQTDYPGHALLYLHPGAMTNPRFIPAKGVWHAEWSTGGCSFYGAGLLRTAGGQSSVLMARVSFYPPGSDRPAIRTFNGIGPQTMPGIDSSVLTQPVGAQDIDGAERHLVDRAPADVAHVLRMYFEYLAGHR